MFRRLLSSTRGTRVRLVALAGIGLLISLATVSATRAVDDTREASAAKAKGKVDFKTDVAPILQKNCVDCHGPVLQLAGLRLDQRRFAIEEGEPRGLIVPKKSDESLVIQRLVDKELGLVMPPSFPFFPGEKAGLAEKEIAILKKWVDEGADWPAGVQLAASSKLAADDPKANALFAAIRAGDRKAVAKRVDDKSLVKKLDKHGSTSAMHAALYSDADMLRLLIDGGSDVNIANEDGVTALFWGAGDAEKVGLLLAKGAKVDVRTGLGRTPLLVAATYAGNVEAVRLLLKAGAKPTDIDNFGETPLTSAAKRGDAQIALALIEAGADIHAGGRPPLVWAAEEGNAETVAILVKHGAGKNKKHLNQALFSAAVRGPDGAVRLLLEHGGDPSAPAGFAGYTPLMGAAYSELESLATVRLMLEKRADVKVKGANGETALSLAKKRGRTQIVELLQKAGAVE